MMAIEMEGGYIKSNIKARMEQVLEHGLCGMFVTYYINPV